jgi:hypothetical protein
VTTILAKHLPYADGHLSVVLDTMEHAGPPTIRAVRYGSDIIALEGSHRVAAAHALGLAPKIVVLAPDTEGCDEFFDNALALLPVYEFPYMLILEVAGMG